MAPDHSGLWLFFHSWAWALWCLRLGLVASGWLVLLWLWWRGTLLLWRAAHTMTEDPTFGPDPLAPVLGALASVCLAMFLWVAGMGWAGVVL